jgi:trans-aconitate methyltransferase
VSFDRIAEEYERGRPSYPSAVYDSLEPLLGALVIEGGAGTGIATSQLVDRGASVVAFDRSHSMIERATQSIPRLRAVIADGAFLPFRDRSADLLCFAQSWHWMDENRRCAEAARVLRVSGRWAAWWSHPRADGETWFDAYYDALERACTGVSRSQRDIDWGETIRASRLFHVDERITIPWVRRVSVETWLTQDRSRPYVASLPEGERENLLREVEDIVRKRFPTGNMIVPYETWLWVANRRNLNNAGLPAAQGDAESGGAGFHRGVPPCVGL